MNARKIIGRVYREHRGVPFVWGKSDCLIFASACAEQIIGRDPAAHLRGRYDSESSMREMLAQEGWRDAGDLAASLFSEIPTASARSGDWTFVVNEDATETIGVVVGAVVVAKTLGGVGQVPMARAKRAFRVE